MLKEEEIVKLNAQVVEQCQVLYIIKQLLENKTNEFNKFMKEFTLLKEIFKKQNVI